MTITSSDISALSHPDRLVGHRLIRRIGSGSRSEFFLGVPEGGGEGVALKVFRPHVTPESIGNELAALGRSRMPHAVRLDDIASGPDGRPIAILRRLPRASLARLVTDREAIELGEAVTILAPLVSTVGALHRAGVVHSAIGPGAVLFGARGEPVLTGFGHAELIAPEQSIAALDRVPAVVSERRRLARFVVGGLERARAGDTQRAVHDLTAWLGDDSTAERFEFVYELEQRLFDLAAPIPVTFSPTPVSIPVPGRVVRDADPAESGGHEGLARQGSHETQSSPRRDARLAERIEHSLRESPRALIVAKVREIAGGVRRPFWIVLGAVATMLVVGFSIIPSTASARPGSHGSAGASAGAHPSGTTPSRRGDSRSAASSAASSTSAGSQPAATPEQAVSTLLSARAVCLRDRSIGCLDAVDESGSAAMAADSATILAAQRGAEQNATHDDGASSNHAPESSSFVLVERLGDAAIVRSLADHRANSATNSTVPQSTTALVLLMSTKAGWRIRDFLDQTAVQP